MRIGIDTRILQVSRRGQGQYVYYLAKTLPEIDASNKYVHFYHGFKSGKFALEDTSLVKQVWCHFPGRILKPLWLSFNFPPVEYFIGKVDVFHHTFNFNFTYYTPIATQAKSVVTFNGMADPATIWVGKFDVSKINRWFDIIAKRSSKIIAVSAMVKEDLLKRVSIDEKRIRIVYYGVDKAFRPIDNRAELEEILSKYNLSGKRYILYIGAADANKNLSGLLDAFKRLSKNSRLEDVYLVFVGSIDVAYRRLIEKAAQLNIKRRVIFTDYIGHEHLPFIYNGAQLFVLPTFYEWFGIPVLEAMRCGTTVAVSKNTGALEVVSDAAITFDPHNIDEMAFAMERALEDRSLSAALREKALQKAVEFSWEKTAQETLAVYKEVCA